MNDLLSSSYYLMKLLWIHTFNSFTENNIIMLMVQKSQTTTWDLFSKKKTVNNGINTTQYLNLVKTPPRFLRAISLPYHQPPTNPQPLDQPTVWGCRCQGAKAAICWSCSIAVIRSTFWSGAAPPGREASGRVIFVKVAPPGGHELSFLPLIFRGGSKKSAAVFFLFVWRFWFKGF